MKNIAFEGMPGAGKTSCLGSIVENYRLDLVYLPEVNPDKYKLSNSSISWKQYHDLWKQRLSIIKKLKINQNLLFDRTYFSSLAYTYAIDNRAEFIIQKNKIMNDFDSKYFDLIIVFICPALIGLERRLKNNDIPPFPWQEQEFLNKFQEFYYKILPQIYPNKLLFIDRYELSLEKSCNYILNVLDEHIPQKKYLYYNSKSIKFNSYIEKKILKFAINENLGRPYTSLINVFGYPTIYFRQYAIQYDNKPIYLDNKRLDCIVKKIVNIR